MTTDNKPPLIPISEFVASKQAGLFQTLKQPRFTGQLVLTAPKGESWVFYLYLGRIMYATGGNHPIRRWRRNLGAYLKGVPVDNVSIKNQLSGLSSEDIKVSWEYELLCLWVEQEQATREQVSKFIYAVLVEIFFDVTQAVQITYQIKKDVSLSTQLTLLDAEQIIADSWKIWQGWQAAKVADRSPNSAPTIRFPEQLEAKTNPKTYQVLTKLLNGNRTLRDLGIIMNRSLVDVTRSLIPYVQAGLIELVPVADLPSPISFDNPNESTGKVHHGDILVACVDDSLLICQTMEKIVTGAGYKFLGINDALRAIAVVLARKPDIIFLDLVMPNANGYEICGQLRKLKIFKDTPIIILTGNDGIIDRVRAKMVGSTDFLSKPVDADMVLDIIRKQTRQQV